MRIVVMDAFKMKKICNVLEISLGRHQVTRLHLLKLPNSLAGFYILKTYSLVFKQNTIHNN